MLRSELHSKKNPKLLKHTARCAFRNQNTKSWKLLR